MTTRTSFIVIGLLAVLVGIVSNTRFLFGSVTEILVFVLTPLFNQRDLVLLIGLGLMGLRWLLVHRKRTDKEQHEALDRVRR